MPGVKIGERITLHGQYARIEPAPFREKPRGPPHGIEQAGAHDSGQIGPDSLSPMHKTPAKAHKTGKASPGHATKYPGVPSLFRALALPLPVPEYEFDAARRWRFDFAWPALRIALEIDGGLFSDGAHNRGAAIVAAHAKLNAAATAGWRVFYCTPQTLRHAPAIMESALKGFT
jgi:hypothetical protein